ncbi:MAG: ATP-binding protein [Chloroflexi bacterium]|nr:ATP-binding protein [Chloroflexota bacterium]
MSNTADVPPGRDDVPLNGAAVSPGPTTDVLAHPTVIAFAQDLELRFTWVFSPQTDSSGTPYHPLFRMVVGRTDMELPSTPEGESLITIKRRVLESGAGTRVELQIPANGAELFFELILEPLRDSAGTLVGLSGAMIDVTARKRAELERERLLSQVEAEQARFNALIENAPEGIVMTDNAGHIVLANPAAGRLYARPVPYGQGIESHAPLQLHRSDGVPYEPIDLPLTRSAMDGETHTNVEMIVVWPDGQRRILLVNTAPIRDRLGHVTGAVGVFQDITERKQAEQAREDALGRTIELYDTSRAIGFARTADEILRVLLAASPVRQCHRALVMVFDHSWVRDDEPPATTEVIAAWDAAGAAPRIGQRYPALSEYWAKTGLRNSPVFVPDIKADTPLPDHMRERLLKTGIHGFTTLPLIARGEWYGLLSFDFPAPNLIHMEDVRYLQGLVDQAATAIFNTRLLEAEAQARREAERANELRLRFLAMISHELRTPLTSIKGFATTLLAKDIQWDEASQNDFIATIDAEADKLTDMIEQLLDLSRIEAGTLRINPEAHTIPRIFAAAMPQLQFLAQHHRLSFDLPIDMPRVHADRQRVAQVLTNLVSNAVKYSPAGTLVSLTVRHVENAVTGMHVVQFDVADQGSGIASEDQPFIFEAFRRGSDDRSRRSKGAGLGLAICKGLVEAHGGRIWVSHLEGMGTTISFTLPVAE